jgi:hypothetical protein
MGYTTEFQGEFACRRRESAQIAMFLNAIHEGDRTALSPLADWLIDLGDPRGEAVSLLATKAPTKLKLLWGLFGLRPEHAAYLHAFRESRRMKRDARKAKLLYDPIREAVGLPLGPQAGYYVGDDWAQSVLDENEPPKGQPGLHCQWMPNDDGTAIVWDGGEKFYYFTEWVEYIIKHFLGPWGYILNGRMTWQGEDEEDTGTILVVENAVEIRAEAR